MTQLFRAMKEAGHGQCEVGESARALGIRPRIDVPATNPGDTVHAGQGGMSVSPDDPQKLPYFRRPPQFGGTGKDPVWTIRDEELGPDLCYRPDPNRPDHGFIEPARPMPLSEYQQALARTQPLWRKV
jgi:hypothetical protein